jgi:hypothetical protein
MILLFEYSDAKVRNDKKGCCYVEGCIAKADFKNRNNRVYPESVLSEAMQELSEKVQAGNAYGMLGHSPNPGIEHDKISHIIESVKQVGKDWHSRVQLIPEGAGKIARAILESGGRLGFSTKSIGDVERHRDGYDLIKPGLKIHSVDLVGDPSSGVFAKTLKESILNEAYSPAEKEIALKILAEDHLRRNSHSARMDEVARIISGKQNFLWERDLGIEALRRIPKYGDELARQQQRVQDQLWNHPGEELFSNHKGFPSIDGDDRTHPERVRDWNRKQNQKLSDLQDEIPIDKSEYPHMTVVDAQIVRLKKYLDFETDPLKRATLKKALRELQVSKAMMKRWTDYISRTKGAF